ncbi:hypothetical protein Pelo_7724 [Pelomyxa schiedti]|nr:hypothetical protein Pelo_7724 [Pelomyxa schiedti]
MAQYSTTTPSSAATDTTSHPSSNVINLPLLPTVARVTGETHGAVIATVSRIVVSLREKIARVASLGSTKDIAAVRSWIQKLHRKANALDSLIRGVLILVWGDVKPRTETNKMVTTVDTSAVVSPEEPFVSTVDSITDTLNKLKILVEVPEVADIIVDSTECISTQIVELHTASLALESSVNYILAWLSWSTKNRVDHHQVT